MAPWRGGPSTAVAEQEVVKSPDNTDLAPLPSPVREEVPAAPGTARVANKAGKTQPKGAFYADEDVLERIRAHGFIHRLQRPRGKHPFRTSFGKLRWRGCIGARKLTTGASRFPSSPQARSPAAAARNRCNGPLRQFHVVPFRRSCGTQRSTCRPRKDGHVRKIGHVPATLDETGCAITSDGGSRLR